MEIYVAEVKEELILGKKDLSCSTDLKRKKENLFHFHESGSVQWLHQNLIWKVEANVYLVNKLSSSAGSSQLFQACRIYLEQTHMLLRFSPCREM